uniref:Uncharacterized protein n=1 Tax=Setaria digitata TaxID=48799 RepID=A0A915Q450_9BILA
MMNTIKILLSPSNSLEATNDTQIELRHYRAKIAVISLFELLSFSKLVQNCVEKNPTTRNCYYWPCKSNNFLTLKRSNVRLEKGDEENEDEEHLDLADMGPESSI